MIPCRACGTPHPDDAGGACPRTGRPVSQGPCGTRIDRYEVLEWLGGGGMGAVYRARHVGIGKAVALKLLRRERAHDAEAVQRLLREAKAAASIPSPHVVQASDFGVSADGEPFMVMELVEGVDLEHHLARKGRLSVDEAVGIVLDVLAGLAVAHAAGVVHRDLKPGNVLLAPDAVKITDFGIAKLLADVPLDALTRTGIALGTPFAMAPEQAKSAKDVDARADLWAVGVILYHALSGRRPFEGASYEDLIVRICTEDPPPLREVAPDLPEPLAAVVMRALAREREARWGSAEELSSALRGAVRAMELAEVPAVDRADDLEEEQVAPPSAGPGLRPSLAFVEVRPRNAWKLPLALVGFLAAAGGLMTMALVLRPVVPAALPAAPVGGGYEVRFAEPRPAATPPVATATPRAGEGGPPPRALVSAPPAPIVLTSLVVEGPLPRDEVQAHIERKLGDLDAYRGREAHQVRCEITFLPNGRPDQVPDARECSSIFNYMRFGPAPRPTHIQLDVLLPPAAPTP